MKGTTRKIARRKVGGIDVMWQTLRWQWPGHINVCNQLTIKISTSERFQEMTYAILNSAFRDLRKNCGNRSGNFLADLQC